MNPSSCCCHSSARLTLDRRSAVEHRLFLVAAGRPDNVQVHLQSHGSSGCQMFYCHSALLFRKSGGNVWYSCRTVGQSDTEILQVEAAKTSVMVTSSTTFLPSCIMSKANISYFGSSHLLLRFKTSHFTNDYWLADTKIYSLQNMTSWKDGAFSLALEFAIVVLCSSKVGTAGTNQLNRDLWSLTKTRCSPF